MNSTEQIAQSIPSEYRRKILLDWLPLAIPSLENEAMRQLFDAWFVYVDPNGVRKDNCPRCILNVLENWQALQSDLLAAEQENNLLNSL